MASFRALGCSALSCSRGAGPASSVALPGSQAPPGRRPRQAQRSNWGRKGQEDEKIPVRILPGSSFLCILFILAKPRDTNVPENRGV